MLIALVFDKQEVFAMKKLNPTVIYSELFVTYWCVYCVITGFSSVFLLDIGYSNTEIGTMLAIGNIVSVIIQPISANIADRSQKLNTLDIAMIMALVIGVFEALVLIVGKRSIVLFVAYLAVIAVHAAMQPLLNSVEGMFLHIGKRADYGLSRSFGSLGYSITSMILGLAIASAGSGFLPLVALGFLALLVIGLVVMQRKYKELAAMAAEAGELSGQSAATEAAELSEPRKEITMKEFMLRHKLFLVIMFGVFLMFYHHQVINYYMLQVFQNVGGDSTDMGLYGSLMTITEVPALMFFTPLNKKFKTNTLLKVGIVGLMLRGIFMYTATSPLGIQLSLIVNPFGFSLFLAAIVKYISEIMDEREAVRGQSLYVVVITASAVVASFTGGIILDVWGASKMLLLCMILCIVGAAISFRLVDDAAQEC